MAIKKGVAEQTETTTDTNETALTTVQHETALSRPEDLISVTDQDYLPRLKVVYPIEVDPNKGIMPKHGYQTMIQKGQCFMEVPDNTYLFGLAGRDCMRASTCVIDGVEVRYEEKNPAHKAAGSKYRLAYGPLAKNKPSQAYVDASKSDLFDRGVAWLVGVFIDDGCMVCEVTGFKSMSKYWNAPFMQANSKTSRVMLLEKSNHCYNLATGKNYLDPKKFNQYKIEPITEDQRALINAAWHEQAAVIKAWLSK